MTCRKGLHPDAGPGYCRACKKARDRRYFQTERGKESHRRAQAKYEAESMTGLQYSLKLLKHRRYKNLKFREERDGAVQDKD